MKKKQSAASTTDVAVAVTALEKQVADLKLELSLMGKIMKQQREIERLQNERIAFLQQNNELTTNAFSHLIACQIDHTRGRVALSAFAEMMQRADDSERLRVIYSESDDAPAVSRATQSGIVIENVRLEVGLCGDWKEF